MKTFPPWFVAAVADRYLLTPALLAVAMLGWPPAKVAAHPTYMTAARAVIQADGTCRVTVQFDLLAFALNDTSERVGNDAMETLLAAPRDERERTLREAGERFARGFAVTADDHPISPATIHFPTVADVTHWRETSQPVLPVAIPVEIEVHLPGNTRAVTFRFPGLLAEIILTVERPGEDFFTEPVAGGKDSTALPLSLQKP